MIVPMISGSGSPIKILEAMAMGKALVASDVGGHKELIQDGYTGRLFPAGSLDGLSNALEALITDHDRRKNLARQGQQWVNENHTWEKTTAVYEKIYGHLYRQSDTDKND